MSNTTNSQPAHADAYTDPGLTVRGPYTGDSADTFPALPTSNDHDEVRVYENEGTDHNPDNSAAPVIPHKPFRVPGHDPYAIDGMPGQDYLKNSAE